MKKQFISALIALSLALTLFPRAAAAANVPLASDTLYIGTAQELRAFADAVRNGNRYTGQNVVLTADIDLGGSAQPWEPIGTIYYASLFDGVFDGNGHMITGLYFNGNSSYGGLFARIGENGIVKNLGVYGLITGKNMLGGITAFNEGTISNCYNGCFIAGSGALIGGIAGYGYGTIENCYNIGSISGTSRTGGIMGTCAGRANGRKGLIQNCYNFGSVIGQDPDTTGGVYGAHKTVSSSVTGCYYLSGTADRGSDYEGEVEKINTSQFALQSTFKGWDFSDIWEMSSQLGRPVLSVHQKWNHEHTYSPLWEYDEAYHWHRCSECGSYTDIIPHTFGEGLVTLSPTEETAGVMTYVCTVCGGARTTQIPQLPHSHHYGPWSYDEENHWQVCTGCGEPDSASPHIWDSGTEILAPTETLPGIKSYTCTLCSASREEAILPLPPAAHTHSYDETWEHDLKRHWHRCAICEEPLEFVSHNWDEGVEEKSPTPTDWGLMVYTCADCGFQRTEVLPAAMEPGPGSGFTLYAPPNGISQPSEPVVGSQSARYDFFLYLDGEYFSLLDDRNLWPDTGIVNEILDNFISGAWVEDLEVHPDRADIYDRLLAGDRFGKALQVHTTGTVSGIELDTLTIFNDQLMDVSASRGDGTMWIEAPSGAYTYQGHTSVATRTAEVYVDHTLPRIVLAGSPRIQLAQGAQYTDPGVFVTDNLDPNVAQSLVIDDSQVDTSQEGIYKVTYTATDHVGNTATAERTVTVGTCAIHVKDGGTVTRQATHEEAGTLTYHCRFCGIEMETVDIPMHTYETEWSNDKSYHWHRCPDCDSQKDRALHHYKAVSAAMDSDGAATKVEVCIHCGYTHQEHLTTVLSIGTAQELLDFAASVNHGEPYFDGYIQLTADIDLSGINWPVIGDSKNFFAGVFDGSGHWVTGLTIEGTEDMDSSYCGGLFGYTRYRPIIQNLGVKGSIRVNERPNGHAVLIGGIVGHHTGGTIQNCYSACFIESRDLAGGIAGINNSFIENCYNIGDISCYQASHAGGITGWNSSNGIIENCYNYGAIRGQVEKKGGVAGDNTDSTAAVISSYYLTGTVEDSSSLRKAPARTFSARGDNSTGEEREEVEFMLEETFTGWDFTDVWTMDDSLGRPTLQSVPETEPIKSDSTPKPTPTPSGPPATPSRPSRPSGSSGGSSSPTSSPSAAATPKPVETPPPPAEEAPPIVARVETVFSDVPAGKWYTDAVQYVYERGLMEGTSKTAFSPSLALSRGALVTILYRAEDLPVSAVPAPFDDTPTGKWYSAAAAWAFSQGIVNGQTGTTFAPLDPVTREQAVVILYRYATHKGYDVTARAELASYPDASTIHAYAREAMSWAVAAGLIQGRTDRRLDPQGPANRAEAAAILSKFLTRYPPAK